MREDHSELIRFLGLASARMNVLVGLPDKKWSFDWRRLKSGKPDQLVPTIETIITAINAGELDGHLSEMGLVRPIRKAAK